MKTCRTFAVILALSLMIACFAGAAALGETQEIPAGDYKTLEITADYSKELKLDNVNVTGTLTINDYSGRIELQRLRIDALIINANDAGEVVLVVGKDARIGRLIVNGRADIIRDTPVSSVKELLVTGEGGHAALFGNFANVSVSAQATLDVAYGSVLKSLAIESGAVVQMAESSTVQSLYVSPVTGMEENPAYAAVGVGANLRKVVAAGMLDVGMQGTVDSVETILEKGFSYNADASQQVIVNVCDEIRNSAGELTATDDTLEKTQINYIGRDYFQQRENALFGAQNDADDSPIALTASGFNMSQYLTKIYDGSAVNTVAVALEGVREGDQVVCSAVLSFSNKNVGHDKNVTVKFVLSGKDAGKYIAPEGLSSADGRITTRWLGFDFSPIADRDYIPEDSIIALDNLQLNNVLPGDDVSINPATAHALMVNPDAGVDKPLFFEHIAVVGNDARNYFPDYPQGKTVTIRKINQDTLSFTGADADYDPLAPYPLTYSGGSGTGALRFTLGKGQGTISGNALTVDACGDFTITVSKAGDNNYFDAQSAPVTINIRKIAQQPLTYTGATNADYNPSQAYALSADGGSGDGAVSFTVANGTGAGALSGSSLTVATCGTFTMTAHKAGDVHYLDAESAPVEVTINKIAQQPLTYTGATNVDYNPSQAYALSATGGSGDGAVSFTVANGTGAGALSGSSLTVATCGTFTMTAYKAGDGHYLPANSAAVLVTINRIKQPSPLTVQSASTVTYLDAYTANVTGGTGTGAITYAVVNGTGSATIDAASGVLTTTQGGGVTLSATKAGDGHYLPQTKEWALTINRRTQTLVLSGANTQLAASNNTFACTASPATSGTYPSVSNDTANTTLNGFTITAARGGSYTLTAKNYGDINYLPASSNSITVTVNKRPTTLSFAGTASAMDVFSSTAVLATNHDANNNDALPVTVAVTGGQGTLSANQDAVTANSAASSIVLTASYAGDDVYAAAQSVSHTIAVRKVDQAFTVSPSTSTEQVAVPVTFSLSGAVSTATTTIAKTGGAACSISGLTVTPNATGSLNLSISNPGDTNYNPRTVTYTMSNIIKAAQQGTLQVNATSVNCGGNTIQASIANKTGSGAVTYSLANNTCGATINSSTGVVTLNTAGTVDVYATIAETNTEYGKTTARITLTANPVAPTITRLGAGVGSFTSSSDYSYSITPTIYNPSGDANYPVSLVSVRIVRTSDQGGYTSKNASVTSTTGSIYPGSYTVTYQVKNSVGVSNTATTTLIAPWTGTSTGSDASIQNGRAVLTFSGSNGMLIDGYSFNASTSAGHSYGYDSWQVKANGSQIDGSTSVTSHYVGSSQSNLMSRGYTSLQFIYQMGNGHESCSGGMSYSVTLAVPRNNGTSD